MASSSASSMLAARMAGRSRPRGEERNGQPAKELTPLMTLFILTQPPGKQSGWWPQRSNLLDDIFWNESVVHYREEKVPPQQKVWGFRTIYQRFCLPWPLLILEEYFNSSMPTNPSVCVGRRWDKLVLIILFWNMCCNTCDYFLATPAALCIWYTNIWDRLIHDVAIQRDRRGNACISSDNLQLPNTNKQVGGYMRSDNLQLLI